MGKYLLIHLLITIKCEHLHNLDTANLYFPKVNNVLLPTTYCLVCSLHNFKKNTCYPHYISRDDRTNTRYFEGKSLCCKNSGLGEDTVETKSKHTLQ